MRDQVKFIAVAGNLGVGKSTLVDYLCRTYGWTPFTEPNEENPFLDDFYEDMPRWAFNSQISFLAHKFRIHLELMETAGTVVQDRTIYEDAEIFATNLARGRYMRKRDYETYMELYSTMREALQPPDLLIYLRCETRAIRRRIKTRGRPSELEIPVSYIRRLGRLYEDWIAGYDQSPVLIWDSGRLDYLTSLVDRIDFQRAVERFL